MKPTLTKLTVLLGTAFCCLFSTASAQEQVLANPIGIEPELTGVVEDDGSYNIQFVGLPGVTYDVFASPDLTNWEFIGSADEFEEGMFGFLDDFAVDYERRFYSVIPNFLARAAADSPCRGVVQKIVQPDGTVTYQLICRGDCPDDGVCRKRSSRNHHGGVREWCGCDDQESSECHIVLFTPGEGEGGGAPQILCAGSCPDGSPCELKETLIYDKDGIEVYQYTCECGGGKAGEGNDNGEASVEHGPVMIDPVQMSSLSNPTATFTWHPDGIPNIQSYWLCLGSEPGGSDIFNSGEIGLITSVEVPNIPITDNVLHVRLWYAINDQWLFKDYSYRAAFDDRDGNGIADVLDTMFTQDLDEAQFQAAVNNAPIVLLNDAARGPEGPKHKAWKEKLREALKERWEEEGLPQSKMGAIWTVVKRFGGGRILGFLLNSWDLRKARRAIKKAYEDAGPKPGWGE